MKTKKTYTLLCSGPLMNGSMLQELVCEGYDPDRARARAKQRLDDEFKGDLFSMKMAAQYENADEDMVYADVIALAHVDDAKLATNFLYITEDLDAAVATDEILYVTWNTDFEIGEDTVTQNAYFMETLASDNIEIDDEDLTYGFWHFSVEDDVYTLTTPGAELTKVDEKTDGYMEGVTFTTENVYKNALTLSADIDDVDFSNAKVVDDRADIAGETYDREINSVARLVKALDSQSVAADLYVKDGEIVFIVVVDAQ